MTDASLLGTNLLFKNGFCGKRLILRLILYLIVITL